MAEELVKVMQWQTLCFGRLWTAKDIVSFVLLLTIHSLALLAPFHFSWPAVWTSTALHFVTGGLGITLSYHRNLAHRSFKLPRWLEYLFAYFGALALQGSPIEWVGSHRSHHQFTDTLNDPHTPVKGFWYSHIGWIFSYDSWYATDDAKSLKNVKDLKNQWYYRFLHNTYVFHASFLGVVLYVVGGLPFLVWGLGVRTVLLYHTTFSINSICHTWGNQAWKTDDMSKNNWVLGLLGLGEGWHNNHHAFEYSARHGLEWWQIDITWYIIRFLEVVGLATNVKLPSDSQKKQKALCNKGI